MQDEERAEDKWEKAQGRERDERKKEKRDIQTGRQARRRAAGAERRRSSR